MFDAFARVNRHLDGAIGIGGRRRQDFADPVGASSNHAVSGRVGMRDRRQPAISGTITSPPRCSSGSSMIHQPPGRPDPGRTGPQTSSSERRIRPCVPRRRARRCMQLAAENLADHVLRQRAEIVITGLAFCRVGHCVDVPIKLASILPPPQPDGECQGMISGRNIRPAIPKAQLCSSTGATSDQASYCQPRGQDQNQHCGDSRSIHFFTLLQGLATARIDA